MKIFDGDKLTRAAALRRLVELRKAGEPISKKLSELERQMEPIVQETADVLQQAIESGVIEVDTVYPTEIGLVAAVLDMEGTVFLTIVKMATAK